MPLGLTAAVSATDWAIHKKTLWPGHPSDLVSHITTLVISNDKKC